MATVNQPLAENAHHIGMLCEIFDLGNRQDRLAPVSGGFHHRMWRVDTPRSRYAIKQFSDDIDFGDTTIRTRLNATEVTARAFARLGIPALASLNRKGEHLQVIDGIGYLVFPWTDSKARKRNAIEPYHAETVAEILAKMHCADIRVAGLGELSHWPLTAERLSTLLELAQQRNVREAAYILARMDDILAVVDRQQAAQSILSHGTTISHGDLDHKNVVWSDCGKPLLIDWESARAINPTYELLMEALDWSGITTHFDHRPFEHFLSVYTVAGGAISIDKIPAAFDAILGAWINWMLYNVGRAAGIGDLRQRAIGSEQIDIAVSALLRLERDIPRLQDIACLCASGNRGDISHV